MALSKRTAVVTSLSAAIAASLAAVSVAAAAERAPVADTQAELAAMRAQAVDKWRRAHPNPPPSHSISDLSIADGYADN